MLIIHDNPRQNTSGIVLPVLCPPNGLSQSEIFERILCFGSIRLFYYYDFFLFFIFVCVDHLRYKKLKQLVMSNVFFDGGFYFFPNIFWNSNHAQPMCFEQCALYTYTIHIILIIIKSSIVYENVRFESDNCDVTSDHCRVVICSGSRVCATTMADS